jgi:Ca-activated chloride channel family protein
MTSTLKVLLFSLFSLLISLFSAPVLAAESSTPMGYLNNRKGVSDLLKGNPSEAQNKFLSGLARDPYDANLHLNLGLTYEALGQVEKAQASYEVALKLAKNDLTRFAAAFNLGETFQKQKKTDEALQFYQTALQFNPESQETKTNIELLTQDQQGKGKGKDDKDKDKKDKNDSGDGDQKNQDQGKDEEKKDDKGDSDKPDEKKEEKPKQYKKNKPQPQKFKSEELSPGDVNKILGEIKQQEQKIRGEFNKKEVKEKPRDKDW